MAPWGAECGMLGWSRNKSIVSLVAVAATVVLAFGGCAVVYVGKRDSACFGAAVRVAAAHGYVADDETLASSVRDLGWDWLAMSASCSVILPNGKVVRFNG
jgi:hypothetical protein